MARGRSRLPERRTRIENLLAGGMRKEKHGGFAPQPPGFYAWGPSQIRDEEEKENQRESSPAGSGLAPESVLGLRPRRALSPAPDSRSVSEGRRKR